MSIKLKKCSSYNFRAKYSQASDIFSRLVVYVHIHYINGIAENIQLLQNSRRFLLQTYNS